MKKLVYIFIMSFCIIFACAFTEGQKIYDKAELLTVEQIQTLEAECLAIAKEKSLDIIILTTSDAEGKTSMAYADDFYDINKFGYEAENGTGILLLIDMDNRNAWISTSGDAITYFTDARIELMLDNIFEYLPNGDYYNSCTAFLADIKTYMGNLPTSSNNTIANNNVVENVKRSYIEIFQDNLFIYIIISIIVGVIGAGAMVVNSGGKMTAGGITYLNKSSVKMNKAFEQYIRTTVTTRKIENNNGGGGGSSTHTSSGGNTHGGGGRSF